MFVSLGCSPLVGYCSQGELRKYGILRLETQKVLSRYQLHSPKLTLASSEKTLVTLRKQQRQKIEEIKKKTNYYTTRNLLDRYDESITSPGTPQRRQVLPQTPVKAPQRQPNQKQGQAKPQNAPAPPTSQTPFTRMFSDQRLLSS